MLNIAYALAGVVLVIFHYCMLQKSNLIDTHYVIPLKSAFALHLHKIEASTL